MSETNTQAENGEELKNSQAESEEQQLEDHEQVENQAEDQLAQGDEQEQGEDEGFKERYFYLAAEMDNMRKRFDREKQNLLKFGNEKVLSELIEVIDNLDRTLDAIKEDSDEKVKNIFVGVDMVRKQFVETLKGHGLEMIESLGEKFDPNFHEAMAQQESEEHEEDTVMMEYQKGYVLNGRLLRPAKVIVAKK